MKRSNVPKANVVYQTSILRREGRIINPADEDGSYSVKKKILYSFLVTRSMKLFACNFIFHTDETPINKTTTFMLKISTSVPPYLPSTNRESIEKCIIAKVGKFPPTIARDHQSVAQLHRSAAGASRLQRRKQVPASSLFSLQVEFSSRGD